MKTLARIKSVGADGMSMRKPWKGYGGGGMVKKAGGGAMQAPWYERQEARGMTGMLHSTVPGRTDKLPMQVGNGSYVLPADIPSALGQGNTLAGGTILDKMFNRGPYGMALQHSRGGSSPHKMRFADGGKTGGTAPIIAAGGEYILSPDQVRAVGSGDLDAGHKILDAFVKQVRDKHIKTLKKLPSPKKN